MKATKTRFKQLSRVKQVLPSQCVGCDSELGYTPREITRDTEFRGELFPITYTHLVCPECDEAILSDAQMIDQVKKVVAAYQQKHYLLTAEKLIGQRKALGYNSQRALLQAAPELPAATLKRIEAGMHAQDASTDALFRKVLEELEKVNMLSLLNQPLAPPIETNSLPFPSDCSPKWDPLAAAACIGFAASSLLLGSASRVANRDSDTSYSEVRIESC
jgi:hypothetical protein